MRWGYALLISSLWGRQDALIFSALDFASPCYNVFECRLDNAPEASRFMSGLTASSILSLIER